ncbi:MAG TPA: alpha/beta hydrolase [Solirubrobacteraceae bacterium]|nr:alpha/beta hydrolase [Solirubrobacteraceae bacterium]
MEVEGTQLFLDLHRPAVDAPVPCVVYFHGGGWARGSRKDNVDARLLPVAAHGVAIASVSYRLVDVAVHPAQLYDGRAAVRWLRAHGAEHGLLTDRIGAWGVSAGGWLALMLGLTGPEPESAVQAAAAWFPTTDLTTVAAERDAANLPRPAFLQGRQVPAMEAALLGVTAVTDDPDTAWAASPLAHAAHAHGPVLLIHGDEDGLVNAQQSYALHDALTEAGHDSQMMLLVGANHEDPAFHKPAVLGATAGFFSAQL